MLYALDRKASLLNWTFITSILFRFMCIVLSQFDHEKYNSLQFQLFQTCVNYLEKKIVCI